MSRNPPVPPGPAGSGCRTPGGLRFDLVRRAFVALQARRDGRRTSGSNSAGPVVVVTLRPETGTVPSRSPLPVTVTGTRKPGV